MARTKHPRNQKSSRKVTKIAQPLVGSRLGVRIVHHRHSGKRLPWYYTSYVLLFFLLVLTGAVLLFASSAARADQQAQGSIDLNGQVNGPPPSEAATITNPKNGAHTSTNLIDVDGSCTPGLLVEIYRYAIFAGSTYCTSQETFHVSITLIPGPNDLKARISDSIGQYGPDSSVVTVYYDLPKQIPGKVPIKEITQRPFLIYTQSIQRGASTTQDTVMKYELNGGKPPYAISINWGDNSNNDVFLQNDEGDFSATHHFKEGGQYTVTISGSDAANNQAIIMTTIAVQGSKGVVFVAQPACNNFASASSTYCLLSNQLVHIVNSIWPAFIVACLMTFSFWLGERVVLSHLPKRLRLHSQK